MWRGHETDGTRVEMMRTENSSSQASSLFDLTGRTVWITGASGLLAEQYAHALSEHGADLVLTDLRPEKAKELAQTLRSEKRSKAWAFEHDVTSKASWEEVLNQISQETPRIDVLVNNAGYTNQSKTANFGASFEEFPLEDWQEILNVNLTGVFLGCQVVGKRMLELKAGNIINIGSLYGVVSPHHRMYEGTGIYQPPA